MPDTLRSVDVVLSWARVDAGTTAILKQRDDGTWDELGRTDANEFTATGLSSERAYVFAAAALEADGGLAAEAEWETIRVAPLADEGTPARPAVPTGFAAAQDGPNLNFRWDAAADGVTATYEVRVGDAWEDAQLVAVDVTGTSYAWPWWSSGPHTFHLKAVDCLGRGSNAATAVALTIAALDNHDTADTADQAAQGWPGTKTHLELDAGALRLQRLPSWSTAATAWSQMTHPWSARSWPTGVYETPAFDAGQVEKQRVEVALSGAQPMDPLGWSRMHMPALGPRVTLVEELVPRGTRGFTSKNTWRTTPLLPVDARVEIDTSPTAGGAWDGWRPYAPGTYEFRRCRLRVTVRGDGLRYVRVPRLVLTRRKFNRKQEGHVVVNCQPVQVVFPVPFQNAPKVTATILGYAGTPLISDVTPTGFTIAGGAAVFEGDPATFAPTVHWQAMGT